MPHIHNNIYRDNLPLFVDGEFILFKEDATQGDPLAIAIYAIGTQPLIRRLDGIIKQVCYVDDAIACSNLERLRRWWDLLDESGQLYGYSLNASRHMFLKKQT